jgi:PAS domain S-box-containing protein
MIKQGWNIFRNLGLGSKFSLLIIFVILLVVSTLGYFLLIQQEEALERELKNRGVSIAKALAANSVDPLIQENFWDLYKNLKALKEMEGVPEQGQNIVIYGMILNAQGILLAHTDPQQVKINQPLPEDTTTQRALMTEKILVQKIGSRDSYEIYDIAVPIEYYGKKLGVVRIGITTRYLKDFLRKTRNRTLVFVSIIGLLGILGGIYFARRLTRPLHTLTLAVETVREGRYPEKMPEAAGAVEIRQLILAFQDMAITLQNRTASLLEKQQELEQNNVRLASTVQELTNLKGNLEKEVDKRTEELALSKKDVENSRNFLATILNNIGEEIIVLNSNYQVISANPYALNMLQRKDKEVKGAYCYQLLHGKSEICSQCPAQKTFQTGEPSKGYYIQTGKNGLAVEVEVNTFPITEVGGEIYRVIMTLRDISLERRLREQDIQLERLATISRLTSSILHQINNPLASIKNYLHLTNHEVPPNCTSSEYLRLIREEIDRITNILRQLTILQSFENGMGSWPIDINRIIENTVKSLGKLPYIKLELAEDIPSITLSPEPLQNILKSVMEIARENLPEGEGLCIKSSLLSRPGTEEQRIVISISPMKIEQMALDEDFTSSTSSMAGRWQKKLPDIKYLIAIEIIKGLGGTLALESTENDEGVCKILLPVAHQ